MYHFFIYYYDKREKSNIIIKAIFINLKNVFYIFQKVRKPEKK